MRPIFLIALVLLSANVQAIEPIRIEIGKSYDSYSNEDLRRRVWQLERAVAQLQDQVFQLAVNGNTAVKAKSWTCQIQSFGKTFAATENTKTAALAKVLRGCSDATNAVHCREADVKCSDE